MSKSFGYDGALAPEEGWFEKHMMIREAIKSGIKLKEDENIPGIPIMFSTHGMNLKECQEKSKELGTIDAMDYIKTIKK
jgi:hypothetical protein